MEYIINAFTSILNTSVFGIFKISDIIILVFAMLLALTIFKVLNHG